MNLSVFQIDRFVDDLDHENIDGFMTRLRSLLASVNYPEGSGPYSEHDFQSSMFIIFAMLGQAVRTEVHTSRGRTDCEIADGNIIYLFEFKVGRDADEALRQMDHLGYADRYAVSGKHVYQIGVSFSAEERGIAEWKTEKKY
ncbi:MAG: PD-(D/E)XK nuclease domain-containing protein [Bulleidia sp.]|nr:PD-(D/E)XK nuclease domain-containing protein [Bulleidia sp.]